MKVTIDVTKKLIAKSRRMLKTNKFRSEYCPVALAIKEIAHKEAYIGVTSVGLDISISDCRNTTYYKFPKTANDFVTSFDRNEKVQPISFNLNIRKEFLRAL